MKNIFLLVIVFASFAFGHTTAFEHGGFISGFMHPISGLDHMLAMVGVGILASFVGKKGFFAIAGFMGAMLLAALIGKSGIKIPFIEEGILLSIAVVFGLIGYAKNISFKLIMGLIAFFGAFHGYAHGAEFTTGSFAMFMLGFMSTTLVLHLTGIVIGHLFTKKVSGQIA